MIGQHGPRDSLQDTTLLEERQNTATCFRRAELLGIMFDQNQTLSNKLNPTLFDSLARAFRVRFSDLNA